MGEMHMQCYHNAERGGRGCWALLGWGGHQARAPWAPLSHPHCSSGKGPHGESVEDGTF